MKTLVLAGILAFGLGGAALACSDDTSGKPCGCKDHHGAMHGKKHGGHHGGHGGCKDMAGMDHPLMGAPEGDDMDCCGKGKHHGHHDESFAKSTGGRPGRAF